MQDQSLEPGEGSAVRVPKAAELIAERLRRRIIQKQIPAGESLPNEVVLMAEFRVSRPTLREAMRILESESLISVRRGERTGARVRSPDARVAARYAGLVLQYRGAPAADVFDTRLLIEPHCAALAAANNTPESIQLLRNALPQSRDQGQLDQTGVESLIVDAMRFHSVIVQIAGNQALTLMSEMISHILQVGLIERFPLESGTWAHDGTQLEASNRAHKKIIELIEAGDAARAEAHWRKHLTQTDEFIFRRGSPGSSHLDLLTK